MHLMLNDAEMADMIRIIVRKLGKGRVLDIEKSIQCEHHRLHRTTKLMNQRSKENRFGMAEFQLSCTLHSISDIESS